MATGTWDEIRTAYHVARAGTVSGAADALGVHHATVIRHVDALEERLGVRLFQRHARGYTPTEAGAELLAVARAADERFEQMAGRLRGQGEAVTGELVVTSLEALSPLLTPALIAFRGEHPGLGVRYLTGALVLRLEYGEAHVAVRAGARPEDPDYVVQPFMPQQVGLYAARSYLDRRGVPDEGELAVHDFASMDDVDGRAPYQRWLAANVPAERIVFRANDPAVLLRAIRCGAGLGFLPTWVTAEEGGLVQVLPPRPDWGAPLWLVTHVDLHRTPKVQAFLRFLKARAKDWERPAAAREAAPG